MCFNSVPNLSSALVYNWSSLSVVILTLHRLPGSSCYRAPSSSVLITYSNYIPRKKTRQTGNYCHRLCVKLGEFFLSSSDVLSQIGSSYWHIAIDFLWLSLISSSWSMLDSDNQYVYMHTRNQVTQRYQVTQEIRHCVHMHCGNLDTVKLCIHVAWHWADSVPNSALFWNHGLVIWSMF